MCRMHKSLDNFMDDRTLDNIDMWDVGEED